MLEEELEEEEPCCSSSQTPPKASRPVECRRCFALGFPPDENVHKTDLERDNHVITHLKVDLDLESIQMHLALKNAMANACFPVENAPEEKPKLSSKTEPSDQKQKVRKSGRPGRKKWLLSECRICGERKLQAKRWRHVAEKHARKALFSCKKCRMTFGSENSSSEHAALPGHKVVDNRPDMQKLFARCFQKDANNQEQKPLNQIRASKKKHKQVIWTGTNHCGLCKKAIRDHSTQRWAHVASAHSKMTLFKCPLCKSSSNYRGIALNHIRQVHKEPKRSPLDGRMQLMDVYKRCFNRQLIFMNLAVNKPNLTPLIKKKRGRPPKKKEPLSLDGGRYQCSTCKFSSLCINEAINHFFVHQSPRAVKKSVQLSLNWVSN